MTKYCDNMPGEVSQVLKNLKILNNLTRGSWLIFQPKQFGLLRIKSEQKSDDLPQSTDEPHKTVSGHECTQDGHGAVGRGQLAEGPGLAKGRVWSVEHEHTLKKNSMIDPPVPVKSSGERAAPPPT